MPTQVYRKPNDPNIYEVGTDRVIGATEFGLGTPTAGRNFSQVQQPAAPVSPTPAAPVSPEVVRDGAGINVKSPVADFSATSKLMQSAKELILRKQNMNKDLTDAATYWRRVYSDPAAFGSDTANRVGAYSDPSDIIFRQLSPGDQASIRAGRSNTAAANLKTIQEERTYRGDTMKETLGSLADMVNQQREADKEKSESASLASLRKMQEAKIKHEAGLKTTAEDWGFGPERGIGDKIGGTDSWRMSNPGMLKYDESTKKFGAKQGLAAPDGGYYATFPSEVMGERALKDAFDSGKMKTSDPYLAKTAFGNMSISAEQMSTDQWKEVLDATKAKNDWQAGSGLSDSTTGNDYTTAKLISTGELLGIDPNILKTYTNGQIVALVYGYKNDIVVKATALLQGQAAKLGISDVGELSTIVDMIASRASRDVVGGS